MASVPKRLLREVARRARGVCEYCLLCERTVAVPHQPDHIVPRKHGGTTDLGNLAWACFFCNSFKGPNVAGVDPLSGGIVPLFHPRRDEWARHFRRRGAAILGRTAIGRSTVEVLRMNRPDLVALRAELLRERLWPGL